jgi:hypothetical protein
MLKSMVKDYIYIKIKIKNKKLENPTISSRPIQLDQCRKI